MKKCNMGVEDQKCPANYAILVVGIKAKREPALNIPNSVIYVEYRKQFLDKIMK